MPVDIHGKQYNTVAERIDEFRKDHSTFGIKTTVLNASDLVQVQAEIYDTEGRLISTGLAEEVRGSTNINKTSALENCETSAVGRALAFFGLPGTEIASADEVANAIKQQEEMAQVQEVKDKAREMLNNVLACQEAARRNIANISVVQEAIAAEDLSTASEAWWEIEESDRDKLWLATTKGGLLSVKEREIIKSDEFAKA
jgi:deoxycytidylate deaminase